MTSGAEYILDKQPNKDGVLFDWSVRPVQGQYPDGGSLVYEAAYTQESDALELQDLRHTIGPSLNGLATMGVVEQNDSSPGLEFVFPLTAIDSIIPGTPSLIRFSVSLDFTNKIIPLSPNEFSWTVDLGKAFSNVVNFGAGRSISSQYVRQWTTSFFGFLSDSVPSTVITARFNPYFTVKPEDTLVGKIRVFCEVISSYFGYLGGDLPPVNMERFLCRRDILEVRKRFPDVEFDPSEEFVLL